MAPDDDSLQMVPGRASVDPRHLLLVGTGPGLGAAVARRFAREGFRLTLVARSGPTLAPIAQELRAAGADVDGVEADAGDPEGLRAALAPRFTAPGAPGVMIYSAARMAFDDLLTVSPEQLADAYAVNVIGAVVTAQLAVPPMRAAGGGTLLFTGGGFADALPPTLATLSLGKVTLRAVATMLARQLREDGLHAGSLTILSQIAPGRRSTQTGSQMSTGRSKTRSQPHGRRSPASKAQARSLPYRGTWCHVLGHLPHVHSFTSTRQSNTEVAT